MELIEPTYKRYLHLGIMYKSAIIRAIIKKARHQSDEPGIIFSYNQIIILK